MSDAEIVKQGHKDGFLDFIRLKSDIGSFCKADYMHRSALGIQ